MIDVYFFLIFALRNYQLLHAIGVRIHFIFNYLVSLVLLTFFIFCHASFVGVFFKQSPKASDCDCIVEFQTVEQDKIILDCGQQYPDSVTASIWWCCHVIVLDCRTFLCGEVGFRSVCHMA